MTTILEGFYKKGTIQRTDPPPGLPEGHVRVILITENQPKPPPRYLTFGKYQTGRMATLEDFRVAEWHGDEEPGDAPGR